MDQEEAIEELERVVKDIRDNTDGTNFADVRAALERLMNVAQSVYDEGWR